MKKELYCICVFKKKIDGDSPCARGGHQMCIDTKEGMIYVFGGWDGRRDLSDFWCYNIRLNEWELLSHDTKL